MTRRRPQMSFEDRFAQLFRLHILTAIGLGTWSGVAYSHHPTATVFQDGCYAALIAAFVYALLTGAQRLLSHTRPKPIPTKRRRR